MVIGSLADVHARGRVARRRFREPGLHAEQVRTPPHPGLVGLAFLVDPFSSQELDGGSRPPSRYSDRMDGKPVRKSHAELSELALPNDANGLNTLLGGKIMHLVDIAGSLAAARHCRRFVVTASFDHMDFLEPVMIGDLVTLKASVNRAFRTSVETGVRVWAENLREDRRRHVASAYLTFVAVDEERRPVEVAAVIPESEDELRRFEEAGERRAYRLSKLKLRSVDGG